MVPHSTPLKPRRPRRTQNRFCWFAETDEGQGRAGGCIAGTLGSLSEISQLAKRLTCFFKVEPAGLLCLKARLPYRRQLLGKGV